MKSRIDEIDIIKAICIILVVAGHASAPGGRFYYLFHVSVFFIVSGYCYTPNAAMSVKNVWYYIKKKIIRLWIPYFGWNALFILSNNFLCSIHIFTDNESCSKYFRSEYIVPQGAMSFLEEAKLVFKSALFGTGSQLCGLLWFLKTLFFISLMYVCLDFLIIGAFKNKKIRLLAQAVLALVFLGLGYWFSVNDIFLHGLVRNFSFYFLFFVGDCIYSYREILENMKWKAYLIILIVSVIFLVALMNFGTIEMSANEYSNPLFLVATAIAGCFFLYSVSYFIKYCFLKRYFVFIGKNTMPILALHLLAFKIVALVIVNLYHLSQDCLAAFPNLYGERGIWWIVYISFGIAIPLVCDHIYNVLKDKCFGKRFAKRNG